MKDNRDSTMRMLGYFVSNFLLLGLAGAILHVLITVSVSGRVEIIHTVFWTLPIEIILVGGTIALALVNLILHPWRRK